MIIFYVAVNCDLPEKVFYLLPFFFFIKKRVHRDLIIRFLQSCIF